VSSQNVKAPSSNRGVSLPVPGLAEKRPSVIVGDQILVKRHDSQKQHWWQGYVHEAHLDKVGLRFSSDFHAFKGQKFDIRFVLNRLPLRRMHHGLDTGSTDTISRLLFPKPQDISIMPSTTTISTLNPANRDLGRNPPQMLAVAAIRNLRPGSGPFIVFGP
jgi:helicase MOV-10